MTIDQLPTLADPTGTVYCPVSKNGADYKLPTGGVSFYQFTVAANSSTALTLANNTRFILTTIGGQTAGRGMYVVNCASNGSMGTSNVLAASGVTFTTGTRSLEVASTNAVWCMCIILTGSVSA